MLATRAPWSAAQVSPLAMSLQYAPVSVPTWTTISLQRGQKPALPTPFPSARPTTPATYVPWLPAFVVASVVLFIAFHVDVIWPLKSASPFVLIPVSRTATTTDGSPWVMSHACVVWVWYQPQAPPEMFHALEFRKYGSLGRTSCGWSRPSRSAQTTDELDESAPSAAAARSLGT